MALWLIRAGSHGEHETRFLKESRVYLTWDKLYRDLSRLETKQDLHDLLLTVYPESKQVTIRNWIEQIWPFAKEIKEGDWVVLPSKLESAVFHFGEITGPYVFQPEADDSFFHLRSVKWIATDIARSYFDRNLLHSFGISKTVCKIARNYAEKRVRAIINLYCTDLAKVGTVWTWGDNNYPPIPVQVSGLTGVVAIAAHLYNRLALKSDGTVWAWGDNQYGQLGDGTNTHRYTPVQVSGLTSVAAIDSSDAHSLALKSDGTVWSWGDNQYGQLGNGTTTDSNIPLKVVNLTGVVAISAGCNHSLALKSNGTVWAWGRNDSDQLGYSSSPPQQGYPRQVISLSDAVAIAGGTRHSLAVKSDGTVQTWGDNQYGQLGDGTIHTNRSTPVQVYGLTGVVAVAGGFAHSLALRNPPVFEEAKLTARDGAAGDQLGVSVAISGYTAVVGAWWDSDNGPKSGSAYVFVRSGGSWTEQAKLTASDGAAGDRFGYSVAISGDTAVVGAYIDDEKGIDSGSAYVFVRSGGIWTEQAKITASDGAAGDQFGLAVAVSGDITIVGALTDGDNGPNSGSAYVFLRSGGSWIEQTKITARDGAAGDQLGVSVALSGDTALVGASHDADNGADSGSAYVFVRSGGSWTEQAKITARDGAVGDQFGYSVAVSGDIAVVGAAHDDDKGASSGSAYVFVRVGGSWTEQAKLTASDGAAGDIFGNSVAVSGDTAVVGACRNADYGPNSGSAYVFVRSSGSWTEQAKLTASDGAAGDYFGLHIAINGGRAVVGAYLDNDYGAASGSAYVYIV